MTELELKRTERRQDEKERERENRGRERIDRKRERVMERGDEGSGGKTEAMGARRGGCVVVVVV